MVFGRHIAELPLWYSLLDVSLKNIVLYISIVCSLPVEPKDDNRILGKKKKKKNLVRVKINIRVIE